MRRFKRRHLLWIANGGLLISAFLLLMPVGMSAYGQWTQAEARREFEAEMEQAVSAEEDGSLGITPKMGKIALTARKSVSTRPKTPLKDKTGKPSAATTKAASAGKKGNIQPSMLAKAVSSKAKDGAAKRKKAQAKAAGKLKLARIVIPSIGVDAIVKERKGSWRWATGPVHEPGTAAPGDFGNCIIAAHRNMWDKTFKDLPRLEFGDSVVITTPKGKYTYLVDMAREVKTHDMAPLKDSYDSRLTLYTCVLPFNAHKRYVVQGLLIDKQPLN